MAKSTERSKRLMALVDEQLNRTPEPAEAARALTSTIQNDEELYHALVTDRFQSVLADYAGRRLHKIRTSTRDNVGTMRAATPSTRGSQFTAAPKQDTREIAVRTQAADNRLREHLLEFRIFGGMKVRDCRRPDLIESYNSYRSQANDNMNMAYFSLRLSRYLENDEDTVEDALNYETVQKIWQDVASKEHIEPEQLENV